MNGTSARVVKRGMPIERQRTVKLGGRDELSEADIRPRAAAGAFDIVGKLRQARVRGAAGSGSAGCRTSAASLSAPRHSGAAPELQHLNGTARQQNGNRTATMRPKVPTDGNTKKQPRGHCR